VTRSVKEKKKQKKTKEGKITGCKYFTAAQKHAAPHGCLCLETARCKRHFLAH
jgi:hypothetical protein